MGDNFLFLCFNNENLGHHYVWSGYLFFALEGGKKTQNLTHLSPSEQT